jgi:hypothetical protein
VKSGHRNRRKFIKESVATAAGLVAMSALPDNRSTVAARVSVEQVRSRGGSGNHHFRDRAAGNPSVRKQRTSWQLARMHQDQETANRSNRGGTPILFDMFDSSDCDEAEAQSVVGSDQGAIQERRLGQQYVIAVAAVAVCDS